MASGENFSLDLGRCVLVSEDTLNSGFDEMSFRKPLTETVYENQGNTRLNITIKNTID
jgi:hypothetical protein